MSSQNKQQHLVVSALIENSQTIIPAFSRISKVSGCSIIDSRFLVLGQHTSAMLFLSGTWDAIAKVENMLQKFEQEHRDVQLQFKRTGLTSQDGESMPYAIDVVGVDKKGVIFEIADFMSANDLVIQEMSSNNYQATQTGAKMFSLHMTINMPLDISIASVRSDFIDFCDRLNLDAIMEPVK